MNCELNGSGNAMGSSHGIANHFKWFQMVKSHSVTDII